METIMRILTKTLYTHDTLEMSTVKTKWKEYFLVEIVFYLQKFLRW